MYKDITFASIREAIEDSATKAARASISIAWNQNETCERCKEPVSSAQFHLGMVTFKTCRICNFRHCGNCIEKHDKPIPLTLIHQSYSQRDHAKIGNWVCKKCEPLAIDVWMHDFRILFREEVDKFYQEYIDGGHNHRLFFSMPGPATDSMARQALRVAQLAEKVADLTGYSFTFKALKYAYYSKELYSMLMKGILSSSISSSCVL